MITKRLLQMAVAYLVFGILIGLGMGISGKFALILVHVHLNLLGWATMALMALIYKAYPEAAATVLAKVHFWMHGLGLPPLMIALAVLMSGNTGADPFVGVFSLITGIGVLAYCVNILRFIR
ncbi:MAG: cytochrome-c oxidase [Acidobacteriota bacterium]